MLFFILGPLLMLTEVAGEIVLPKIMASMIDSGIGAEVAGLGTGYILSRALLMIACIRYYDNRRYRRSFLCD